MTEIQNEHDLYKNHFSTKRDDYEVLEREFKKL